MQDDKFTKGMRGEFRGDFTRDSFDPMRHFSRVLMQQGRVQLDADWNEQVSILLHYMRQLGRDLMGPHGAPCGDDGEKGVGFEITANGEKLDFSISSGSYYVNGIRCCENESNRTFRNQQDFPLMPDEEIKNEKDPLAQGGQYLVYLDVWERHLTYVEDDYMREKALGGADTAARAQIVWQVRVTPNQDIKKDTPYNEFLAALPSYREDKHKPKVKARARKASEQDNDPCLTAPEASYRGAENQLYRVEIHNSGVAGTATFKWSRENGSVIFPILDIGDGTITLEHLGRDDRFGLQPGDWVEVLDDDVILRNEANPLLKVTAVDRESFQVTLSLNEDTIDTEKLFAKIAMDLRGNKIDKHPYLRRWDQKKGVNEDGVIPVIEGSKEGNWILLEDGVEVQFYSSVRRPLLDYSTNEKRLIVKKNVIEIKKNNNQKDEKNVPSSEEVVGIKGQEEGVVYKFNYPVYQTGDYWLIPARIATEDVEWPQDKNGNPGAVSPQGVEHHYAPLAIITVNGNANGNSIVVQDSIIDLRRQLKQLWEPANKSE